MIVYPAEWNARKEALFTALAEVAGGGRRLALPALSFRDWPETSARVDAAMARAKKQPIAAPARLMKRLLIRGQYNWARAHFTRHPDQIAVAWNGLTGSRMAFLSGARDAGAATLHAELAPLPDRITLDPVGVNAEGSVPQDPAFFRDWASQSPDRQDEGWRALGTNLTARSSRRADVGQGQAALPETPFLFCPLQVLDDSQVTLFAGWCGGMAGFLAALGAAARHLPDGWHLRIKEHPSAKTSLAPMIAPLLAEGRVQLDNGTDSFAQIAASRGVVTLNSSMGLQSFFHDKPVITLGRAFFALPGLVEPAVDQDGLDRLFAGAESLTFDSRLRAAFMHWLDQVYYPRFAVGSDGKAAFDRGAFAARLEQARLLAASRL